MAWLLTGPVTTVGDGIIGWTQSGSPATVDSNGGGLIVDHVQASQDIACTKGIESCFFAQGGAELGGPSDPWGAIIYGPSDDATTDALLVQTGTGASDKSLQVRSDGAIGFYGHTPAAQQTGVAVTAAGIHAALVTLGLITA